MSDTKPEEQSKLAPLIIGAFAIAVGIYMNFGGSSHATPDVEVSAPNK